MSKSKVKPGFDTIMRKYGIYVIFLVLVIAASLSTESFLTVKNITNVLRQISVMGVLALAEMMLIISGQIDLSVGSIVALAGMLSVNAYLIVCSGNHSGHAAECVQRYYGCEGETAGVHCDDGDGLDCQRSVLSVYKWTGCL